MNLDQALATLRTVAEHRPAQVSWNIWDLDGDTLTAHFRTPAGGQEHLAAALRDLADAASIVIAAVEFAIARETNQATRRQPGDGRQ